LNGPYATIGLVPSALLWLCHESLHGQCHPSLFDPSEAKPNNI
jgi:hypothetical protein